MKIKYFKSASGFRRWLEVNHARVSEIWVGFFKKDSGKTGLTYAEAVDEALCFGWIDGLKKRVDELSYTHRFTPRTEEQPESDQHSARRAVEEDGAHDTRRAQSLRGARAGAVRERADL